MTTVEVFAPAKVNLALHVTGQRDDGYHTLDTLVAFAGVGDVLRMSHYEVSSITVEGPEAAGVPADMDNLALRAAALGAAGQGVSIKLDKRLPVASGIGGGSADAAAAFRGALALTGVDEADASVLLALGADVPMCLKSEPVRATGIGERLEFVTLPPVPAVLVNPRVPVSTPEVFRALESRDNAPIGEMPESFADASDLIDWLGGCRNDLEAPARGIVPKIGDVLGALERLDGVGLVRMSGSGATCFALFADEDRARAGAAKMRSDHPGWWVAGCVLGD